MSVTHEEARAVVDAVMDDAIWALQLQSWSIDVVYRTLEVNMAECGVSPNYRRAEITIDWTKHADVDDVLVSLRHELLHVLHAEFDGLHSGVQKLAMTERERDLVRSLWHQASERIVVMLERMLTHGLGLRNMHELVAVSRRMRAGEEARS